MFNKSSPIRVATSLQRAKREVLFSFPPTWRRWRRLQDDVLLINTDDEQWLNVTKLRCSDTQSIHQSTGVSLFQILPQQFPRELKFMFSFRVEVLLFYRWSSVIYFGADYMVTVCKVKRQEIIVSDISTEGQIAVGLLWVTTRCGLADGVSCPRIIQSEISLVHYCLIK
jgi:hypothetical protein